MRKTTPFLAKPARFTVVSLLFTSSVAAFELIFLTPGFLCSEPHHLLRGAHILQALRVAFFGGLAGSVLILIVRKQRHLLGPALLFGAAILSGAIGLELEPK